MKFVFKICLLNLFLISIEIGKNFHVTWLKHFLSYQKDHLSIVVVVLSSLYYPFFISLFFSFLLLSLLIFSGVGRRGQSLIVFCKTFEIYRLSNSDTS